MLGLRIVRQLAQPGDKHAQRVGGLAQIMAGRRQKLRLGPSGYLSLFFFLAQLRRCQRNALRHLFVAELQPLGHLVQAFLQVTQRVIGPHFIAH